MSIGTFTTTSMLARAGSSLLLIWMVTGLAVPALAADDSYQPKPGDWFEYDYNTYLENGYGWYYGYTETMRSHSRYDIVAQSGSTLTVHRTGRWYYQASDGSYESSSIDAYFHFDLRTRQYAPGEVDMDFQTLDPRVWFWIPTWTVEGDWVKVLDDYYQSTDDDCTVWCGLVPYKGMRLETTGSFLRDDVYGYYYAEYRDVYYFDRNTGFIIAEDYNEDDYYYNDGFHWREEVRLTASSFAVPIDYGQLLGVYVGIPAVALGAVAVGWRLYFGPSRYRFKAEPGKPTSSPMEVRLKRLWSTKRLVGMEWAGSSNFAPLVPSFAARALSMRDPVVAAFSGGKVVGLAIKNRESAMGTVFAEDPRVAKALLKRLPVKHFFLDTREENWKVPGAVLVDTFDVLRLRGPRAQPFDAGRIRAMTERDLPTVTRIAEQVYKGRAKRWIEHSFRGGDVGFVAVDRGRVVGFAFATVAGRTARLHTLTVLPQNRSHGLGKDLMAARLNTLAALEVEEVLVEISRFNLASLSVARRAGFAKVGESAYLSRNPDLMLTEAHRRL